MQTIKLEREAYPALDELTSKISTLNLERVRQIKSRLVAISGRVQKVLRSIPNTQRPILFYVKWSCPLLVARKKVISWIDRHSRILIVSHLVLFFVVCYSPFLSVALQVFLVCAEVVGTSCSGFMSCARRIFSLSWGFGGCFLRRQQLLEFAFPLWSWCHVITLFLSHLVVLVGLGVKSDDFTWSEEFICCLKVRDEIEQLLDDDGDMAEMYLTDKLLRQQLDEPLSPNSSDTCFGSPTLASLPILESHVPPVDLEESLLSHQPDSPKHNEER